MAAKPGERVSESAQTAFRDSESQCLEWDITKEPTQHPSKFPRGRGLWYPVLYNPGAMLFPEFSTFSIFWLMHARSVLSWQ
jgi:hypothetical protein